MICIEQTSVILRDYKLERERDIIAPGCQELRSWSRNYNNNYGSITLSSQNKDLTFILILGSHFHESGLTLHALLEHKILKVRI